MFKPNLGVHDRIIRIVLGLLAISLIYFAKTWFGLLGLYPLITGIVGACPIDNYLKIDTRPPKHLEPRF